jgi:hypothetical protein
MNLAPEILFGFGALLLFGVLAWAVIANKRRNRANDAITDAATRDMHEHPDTYQARRGKFEKQLRPK